MAMSNEAPPAAASLFFAELRRLMDEYDVDFCAADDGNVPGLAKSVIQVQFNNPYDLYEFEFLSSEMNKIHINDARVV